MTFQLNRHSYAKKCETLAQYYFNLATEWRYMALSLKQHGITKEIREHIDKRITATTKEIKSVK